MRVRTLGRRRFIVLLGGAAAWLLAGHAQQPERLRRVGVVIPFLENDPSSQARVTAFAQALGRFGWVEGKNIRIDYRFAAGDPTLYQTYAAELVAMMPDAILASPQPATAALRQLTRTIPIVAVYLADPVGQGFVQSLARPGGNITGFSSYDPPMIGKWLQLLKEVAPRVTRVAVIYNPDTAFAPPLDREIETARSFGVTATLAPVRDDAGIEEAIAAQARAPGGLITLPDSFNLTLPIAMHHRRRGPPQFARYRDRHISQVWRPDVLLVRLSRPVRAGGILHRPHPQGRQSGRPPRSAADEIFADHQP
jgi:putative tryptophan/tyrosine transport system substrate-binding protein